MRKGNSLRAFSGLSIGSKSNVDPSPRKPLNIKQDDDQDRVDYNIKSNDNEKKVQIQPIPSRVEINNDAEEWGTEEIEEESGSRFPMRIIIPVVVLLGWIIAAIQLSFYIYICSELLNSANFRLISADVDAYALQRNQSGNDDESTRNLLIDLVIVSIFVNCIYIIAHCVLIYGAVKDDFRICLGWCITIGICMLFRIITIIIAQLIMFTYMGVEMIFEVIAIGFILLFVMDIRKRHILKEIESIDQISKTSLIGESSATNIISNTIPEARKDNKIIPILTSPDETIGPTKRTIKSNEEIKSILTKREEKEKPKNIYEYDSPPSSSKQKPLEVIKSDKEMLNEPIGQPKRVPFFSWMRYPMSDDSTKQPIEQGKNEPKNEPNAPSGPSRSSKQPEIPDPEESKPHKKKGRRRSSTGESMLKAMKRH